MTAESTKEDVHAGEEMPDGTVYVGISPDTHRPMYATPKDAPLTYTFHEAAAYARRQSAQKFLGHDDWRVPASGEVNTLYENRNEGKLKGTFNETGPFNAVMYWSSSPDDYYFIIGRTQCFADGRGYDLHKNLDFSLRLVR